MTRKFWIWAGYLISCAIAWAGGSLVIWHHHPAHPYSAYFLGCFVTALVSCVYWAGYMEANDSKYLPRNVLKD